MLKRVFDNVLLAVGLVALLIASFFAIAYFAIPLEVLIAIFCFSIGLIGLTYLANLVKRYAQTKDIPQWLQPKNASLNKAQKQIWESLKKQ